MVFIRVRCVHSGRALWSFVFLNSFQRAPRGRSVHSGKHLGSSRVRCVRPGRRWAHSGASWVSFWRTLGVVGYIRARRGAVGFIRLHPSIVGFTGARRSLGLFGVVTYIRACPGCRYVRSDSLGSFVSALGGRSVHSSAL